MSHWIQWIQLIRGHCTESQTHMRTRSLQKVVEIAPRSAERQYRCQWLFLKTLNIIYIYIIWIIKYIINIYIYTYVYMASHSTRSLAFNSAPVNATVMLRCVALGKTPYSHPPSQQKVTGTKGDLSQKSRKKEDVGGFANVCNPFFKPARVRCCVSVLLCVSKIFKKSNKAKASSPVLPTKP